MEGIRVPWQKSKVDIRFRRQWGDHQRCLCRRKTGSELWFRQSGLAACAKRTGRMDQGPRDQLLLPRSQPVTWTILASVHSFIRQSINDQLPVYALLSAGYSGELLSELHETWVPSCHSVPSDCKLPEPWPSPSACHRTRYARGSELREREAVACSPGLSMPWPGAMWDSALKAVALCAQVKEGWD